MNQKTEAQLEKEANAATAMLSGVVRRLMDDGVEAAALVEALADALGVMLAAAPRHLAERIEASVIERLRTQRAATWAAIDSAAEVH